MVQPVFPVYVAAISLILQRVLYSSSQGLNLMSMEDLNDFEKHYNNYMNRRKADDGQILDPDGISQVVRQPFNPDDNAGYQSIDRTDQIAEPLDMDSNQSSPLITVFGLPNPDFEKGIVYSELGDHGDAGAEIIPVSSEMGETPDNYSETLPEMPLVKQFEILRPAIIAEDNKDSSEDFAEDPSRNNDIFARKSRSRFRPYYKHVTPNQNLSNPPKDVQDFNKLSSSKDEPLPLTVVDEDHNNLNNSRPSEEAHQNIAGEKVHKEFLVPAYAIHSRPENKSMDKGNRKILIVINEDMLRHANVSSFENPTTKSPNKIPYDYNVSQDGRSKEKNPLTFLDNTFNFAALSRLMQQDDRSPNVAPVSNQDLDSNYLSLIQHLLKPHEQVGGYNHSKYYPVKPNDRTALDLVQYLNPATTGSVNPPASAAQYIISHESPNHNYMLENSGQATKNKLINDLMDLQRIFKPKPFVHVRNGKIPEPLMQNEDDIKNLRKVPEYQTINLDNLKPNNVIEENPSILKYKYPEMDNDVLALNIFGGYNPYMPMPLRNPVSAGNGIETKNEPGKSQITFIPFNQPQSIPSINLQSLPQSLPFNQASSSRKFLTSQYPLRRAGQFSDVSKNVLDERIPKESQQYIKKALETLNNINLLSLVLNDDALKKYDPKAPKYEQSNQPTSKYPSLQRANFILPNRENITRLNEQPKVPGFYRRPDGDQSPIPSPSVTQRYYLQDPTVASALQRIPLDAQHLADQVPYASYLPSQLTNPYKTLTALSFGRLGDDFQNGNSPEPNGRQNLSSIYYSPDGTKFEPIKGPADLYGSPTKQNVFHYSAPTVLQSNPVYKRAQVSPHNGVFSVVGDYPFPVQSSFVPIEVTPNSPEQPAVFEPFVPGSSSFFNYPSTEEIPASKDVFSVVFRDHKSEHKMIGPLYGTGVRLCKYLAPSN